MSSLIRKIYFFRPKFESENKKHDKKQEWQQAKLFDENEDDRKDYIREALVFDKARFNISTCDFLKMDLCCKRFWSLKNLRDSVSNRKVLNYRLGNEELNKELDLGRIL